MQGPTASMGPSPNQQPQNAMGGPPPNTAFAQFMQANPQIMQMLQQRGMMQGMPGQAGQQGQSQGLTPQGNLPPGMKY